VRKYPERPVVGVGAVVFDQGRVLMVKRGHPPLKGDWSLPGGAVELGETLQAAVAREVLEETGLVVDVGPVVEVIDRVHRDTDGRVEYHYIVVDYLCQANGPADVGPLAGSDADDVQWVPIEDLAALRVQAAAIAVIGKAAGQLPRSN
jgi:ADP-ribose pyrophosphatase YjhB (NUDIX family)